MNCKHCQSPLDGGVTICPNCGFDNTETAGDATPAAETPEAASTQETAEAAPAPETAEAAPAAETPAPDGTEETPAAAPEQKKKSGKKLAAILAGVVLVAAVGVAGWLLLRQGDAPEATDPALSGESTAETGETGGETLAPQETLAVQMNANYTYQGEGVAPGMDKVVAQMGDKGMTNGALNACYWITYYDFLNTYGSNAAYLGLDTTKPLNEQTYATDNGEMNWQQFFLEQALATWSRYQALALEAEANGFTLSESSQAQLDGMEEELESSAGDYGFDSLDDMLAADFGEGVTIEDYKNFMSVVMLGNEYYATLVDGITATPEEVETYFDENAESFAVYGVEKDDTPAYISVRHILIQPEGEMEGTDDSGSAVYSEEQMAEARTEAQRILDEWKAGEATEESFAALATEYSADTGSASNGGLYEQVTEGQMVTAFNDWCFDTSRQPGDTDLVETEYGVHIMYFVGASEYTQWYSAAESMLLNEKVEQMIQDCVDAHPFTVNYEDIVLTDVDTTSAS